MTASACLLKSESGRPSRLISTLARAPARAASASAHPCCDVGGELCRGRLLQLREPGLQLPGLLKNFERHLGGQPQGLLHKWGAFFLRPAIRGHHLTESGCIPVHRLGEESAHLFELVCVEPGQARGHRTERRTHGPGGGCGAAAAWSRRRSGERIEELAQTAALAGRFGQAILEDHGRLKIFDLQIIFRRHFDRFFWNQADNFTGGHGHAVAFRLPLHGLEDAMDGGRFKIGEVHGYLCQPAGLERDAHGLDVAEAAGGEAHGAGDLLCHSGVRGPEKNVVSDQELPCADGGGAGGRMQHGLAHIGIALGIPAHLLAQGLELPAADVLQLDALRPLRGGLIEVAGNPQPLPELGGRTLGELRAVLHRHSRQRDERQHVQRADARMRALMRVQIDQLDGFRGPGQRRLHRRFRRGREGDDAPVMVGVHLRIEQHDAGHGADRLDDGPDPGCVAAFAEVGNALNQSLFHEWIPLPAA